MSADLKPIDEPGRVPTFDDAFVRLSEMNRERARRFLYEDGRTASEVYADAEKRRAEVQPRKGHR